MKKQKLKILLGSIIVFAFAFGITTFIKASAGNNTTGWLWAGSDTNVGWISANNTNPTAGGNVPYGIYIPESDGEVTGYAWSQNLGYIVFDNYSGYLDNCPAEPCSSRRVGDNLQGWARFLEIKKALDVNNSGGWEGWIKLNPKNGGVSIDKTTGNLKGYAWSNELGWIDFSMAKTGPGTPEPPIVPSYKCYNPLPECPKTEGVAQCVNENDNSVVDMSNCPGCEPKTITCDEPEKESTTKRGIMREVAP